MTMRPNGKRLKRTGALAFVAGASAITVNTLDFLWPGVLNYHPISEFLDMVAIFGILLGALVWIAGHIVYAISFIPGREE